MWFFVVFGLWILFSIWWGYMCFSADKRNWL